MHFFFIKGLFQYRIWTRSFSISDFKSVSWSFQHVNCKLYQKKKKEVISAGNYSVINCLLFDVLRKCFHYYASVFGPQLMSWNHVGETKLCITICNQASRAVGKWLSSFAVKGLISKNINQDIFFTITISNCFVRKKVKNRNVNKWRTW